jgi:hypothetical protein
MPTLKQTSSIQFKLDFLKINLKCEKSNKRIKEYICFQSATFASPVYSGSNTGQSQTGAIFDVVFKWFRRVTAKICFSIKFPNVNSREEKGNWRRDWNFFAYNVFEKN